MAKRRPVSSPKNVWFNNRSVDDLDLTLEQNYNDTISSSAIESHVGSGVLPEVLVQNILFDSILETGNLDGKPVYVQNQPIDNNFGNQLEISLFKSKVTSNRTIKLAIIGLDFQSNLRYETFYFKANETQISKKHFTKILVLLFNDFIGNQSLSLNLGGQIIIKEAKPLYLSRSALMVAQDLQPNLFFRDFFVDGFSSLTLLLQSALPLYNVDTLNILIGNLDKKVLSSGDVTTHIGEKFLATTNNIQKITLLLSTRNLVVGSELDLVWNGDLIVSIYQLQSSIDSPSDIAPNLPIDFSPSNIPIAQISVNYDSLLASGIILGSVSQPVDFIFSNSPIASGNVMKVGSYYAVTVKRSGAANKCDILLDTGAKIINNSRITAFTGSLWVDFPDEQLWFKVWTDAAKISDGQAYESGHGIILPKVAQDPLTLSTVDFQKDLLQFYGNDVFQAVVSATTKKSDVIPDQNTGNPVFSKQEFVPSINLLNTIDLANLEKVSEPLSIGVITDKNRKFFDSISSLINSQLYSATLVKDELLIKIIDDPTDVSRYNTSVVGLQSNLLNGDFVGAKLIPNSNNPLAVYKIADAKLCSYILGDVDGNGVIDINDVNILNTYIGTDLTTGKPVNTNIVTGGGNTTFINGYLTETQPFTNLFSATFQVVNSSGVIIANGTDGVLISNPNDQRLAQFTSASVNFSAIIGLIGLKLVVLAPGNDPDNGGFDIIGLDINTDVITIRKNVLSGDVIGQLLRSDIDGDFHITYNDGYLLQSYVNKMSMVSSSTIYPAPTTNPFTKIGTTFNVIRFKLEKFVDRLDDYISTPINRSALLHSKPDLFLSDGYFASHNLAVNPSNITIQKVLTWDESLIIYNSNPKFVPSVFTTLKGLVTQECIINGIQCSVYGSPPSFDPGRIDFYVPNNLILGDGGELQRPSGDFYKVDFEVGTIVLEIPDGLFGSERTINVFEDFIADYTGNGITKLGFPAMRFADCSYVKSNALLKDQLRLSASVQSFSPNTNGLSNDGYSGIIIDSKMGVSIDYSTGLLTLNFTNLYQDAVLPTLSTKVQIHVFLKKGGFNNKPIFINSTKVQNMLKLISVFSGANEGGPSALVKLDMDVTGVLPIIHGGSGLSSIGASGTVLMSNGSALSYQFITSQNVGYTAAVSGNWSGSPPTTVKAALDRIAAFIGPIP